MKVKIIDQPIPRKPTFEELRKGIIPTAPKLDELINNFIKGKKVIDIEYQSNMFYAASNGVSDIQYEPSTLIMYEEEEQ